LKILITGHLGYVGPNLIRYLRKNASDDVLVGYDTGYFGTCLTGIDSLPEALVDVQYYGDVRDFPPSLLVGVDAVIHLAAISNDPMGNKFEQVTDDINFEASVDLARKAKEAGVRNFVFASSCSVYGFGSDEARIESSELNPLTAYARSKVRTEEELLKLSSPDFITTSLRFATACGMSDRLRLDLVLNDFVASAFVTKKITILSDGMPWRPLINTLDMARALSWAVRRTVDNGGINLIVNVGSNQWNYQVKEIAAFVQDQIPGTEISINPLQKPDKRSYRVNFDLFSSLAPGHVPQITIQQTISDLIIGLGNLAFNDFDFRTSNLIRLNKLMDLKEKNLIDDQLRW
jgi:nucleoside-diphosphate-sugar epimerase